LKRDDTRSHKSREGDNIGFVEYYLQNHTVRHQWFANPPSSSGIALPLGMTDAIDGCYYCSNLLAQLPFVNILQLIERYSSDLERCCVWED